MPPASPPRVGLGSARGRGAAAGLAGASGAPPTGASPAGEATQLVLCNSRAAAEAVRHLQRKLRMANARNAELTAENARLAELADEQQAIALEAEQALREEGAAVAARLAEVRVGFEASTAEAEKLRAALSEAQAKLAASEAREAEWRRRAGE